jgi:hypothetical protein
MKKILLLLCGFLLSLHVLAQQPAKLSLYVYDADDKEPLADVTLQLFDEDEKMSGFAITNGNGYAQISDAGIYMVCSFMGYNSLKVALETLRKSSPARLYLQPSSIDLKEVVVKAPPITAKNDTIVYSVNALKAEYDRHLDDVLKKLPGVTVADNGKISYQGQTISRFYIEGQDLLGSNYNQAVQNLPVEAVSNVEVLEHNQNVKVLKDKVFEEKAALNIRLNKHYKQRPFGELQLGAGLSPWIGDNRLFLSQVGPNAQTIITGKMNNKGEDLSKDVLDQVDIENLGFYEPLPELFVQTGKSFTSPVADNRLLNNRSYFGGVNHLVKLSKDATLRFNLAGYQDRTTQHTLYDYTFGGHYETSYTDLSDIRYHALTLKPSVKYELNADKAYVSDELTFSYACNRKEDALTTGGTQIQQQARTIPIWVQNRFKSTFSAGGLLLGVNSFFRDYSAGQELAISQQLTEYHYQSTITKNHITTGVRMFGHLLDFGIGWDYRRDRYQAKSAVSTSSTDVYIPLTYSVRYADNGYLTLSSPIHWQSHVLDGISEKQEERFVTASPSLNLHQKVNRYLSFSMSGAWIKNEETASYYATDTLRQDYRIHYMSPDSLSFGTTSRASFSLDYHNLYHMFFTSLSATYIHRVRGSYRELNYAPLATVVTLHSGRNKQNTLLVNLTADKTFASAGWSLKSEANYARMDYRIVQNGLLTDNTSNSFNMTFSAVFQKFKWMTAVAEGNYAMYWQDNSQTERNLLHTITEKVKLNFFMARKWELHLSFENFTNEVEGKHFKHATFFDGALTYKCSKRLIFEGCADNLLNRTTYSYLIQSGVNQTYSELPLRGREITLKVIFKL